MKCPGLALAADVGHFLCAEFWGGYRFVGANYLWKYVEEIA